MYGGGAPEIACSLAVSKKADTVRPRGTPAPCSALRRGRRSSPVFALRSARSRLWSSTPCAPLPRPLRPSPWPSQKTRACPPSPRVRERHAQRRAVWPAWPWRVWQPSGLTLVVSVGPLFSFFPPSDGRQVPASEREQPSSRRGLQPARHQRCVSTRGSLAFFFSSFLFSLVLPDAACVYVPA